MRRWIALIGVVAAVAVTGTALALTDNADKPDQTDDKEVAAEYEAPEIITIEADKTPSEPVEEPEEEDLEVKETDAPEEPADITPPSLAILHPVDGQVSEKKEVVFEGTTDPDARVFAGKYEADVKDDGSWRIVLYLAPGTNSVTFKAKDGAGNVATASVTVTYKAPETDKPKDGEGEDKPKDGEGGDWEFSANQQFGVCSETPPYDVFHGKGKPGTAIYVKSEFGNGVTEVGEDGHWEIKVFFETAPIGVTFPVKVKDEFGNYEVFEFTHTD
jgi:hypothetical protein